MLKQIVFLVLAVFMVTSCINNSNEETKPTVTVSIVPQKFFVDQIAGSWLNVNVMIPPGGSPATYEPTPLQMTNLSKSLVYFRIGHIIFEKAWMHKLTSIHPELKVVNTSEGIDLIAEEAFGNEHIESSGHSHRHEGYNPHIWLSPDLVKKQTQVICKTLCELYPEHAVEMNENLKRFFMQIDSVHSVLNENLKSAHGSSFIVYHPVWSYLAKDYGLKQIAIEHNGKEATADKMRQIIDFANENSIRIIFVQKEFSDDQAKSIANEINGSVAPLNPLDYNWFNIMKEFGDVFKRINNDDG